MIRFLILLCAALLVITGCDRALPPEDEAPAVVEAPTTPVPAERRCRDCHAMDLDQNHAMDCTVCHQGKSPATSSQLAHVGLISQPAHPERMATFCGPCHQKIVQQAAASLHFTLAKMVNLVRRRFGATEPLDSLLEIPQHDSPATPLELVDDLLRRRCLRCHVYSAGDDYPETRHGTGCAACHLVYGNGQLQSHRFIRLPDDATCLHCHYGNRVGADYYGRFEHDFNWEYRTPFGNDPNEARAYGVEYHELVPDIHQLRGLACIDCHPGSHLMNNDSASGPTASLTCVTCHATDMPDNPAILPANLTIQGDHLVLRTKLSNRLIRIPKPVDPAHKTDGNGVACAVCHAQWSFNDQATHLLRSDLSDFDPWFALSVQGSDRVEAAIDGYSSSTADDNDTPWMRDGITGTPKRGIWLKGFDQRRWRPVRIGRDHDIILAVMRPILDLHLSYMDQDGLVRFDSISGTKATPSLLPYTPHTIGRAGAFFRQRLLIPAPSDTGDSATHASSTVPTP